ncbi:MAG TPA: TetR/AcrR family transcriptional regulator [Actinocrinis sp.]|nr:TetR/AcrR family transcriptional regulator [Actinocrinis sp.]
MTDVEQTRRGDGRTDKRGRMVESACRLLHEQGVAGTTLADVAKDAGVVVGNIYYYFKTKDDLVQAVIDAHADMIRTALGALDQDPDPRARLKGFTRVLAASGDYAARFGCPHGTLSSELGKREDGMDRASAAMMTLYVDWAQRQFRLLGQDESAARDHAVMFVSVYQGASLLANTFRDPGLLVAQARQLDAWIDAVV